MSADPDLIIYATFAFLIAGGVKGLVGMGLPTAALGLMTLFIDPRTAIALILFPMMATNAWQMITAGELGQTAKRYKVFAGILLIGVALTTFLTANAADSLLLGSLGAVILLFVWFSWANWIPKLPSNFDTGAQVVFGAFAGIIGGMTASWAAPVGMYLGARQVTKQEFIRATGFLIFVGSIPLCLAYAQLGFLTGPLSLISALMLLPAFLGMWLGSLFRSKLSGEGFKTAVLVVFVVLALNLIRRALI